MRTSRPIYIGDSKYYKMGHELGSESIYKQYTYARNVIQWNLDIFNSGKITESGIRLRDDVTEGYNIIPNFFVSAKMDEGFNYTNDGIEKTDRKKNRHKQVQFNNRLFDRDTLLLFHYDVNFLFVLSLYARNNAGQKKQWKQKIRERFRSEIQEWLQQDYDFYAMKAHPDVNGEEYIKKHFKELLGKVYTPFAEDGVYSLALDTTNDKNKAENERLLNELKEYFFVANCKLGEQPDKVLQKPISEGYSPVADATKDGVLMVMMENYEGKKQKFQPTGKLAVGIKYTRDGIEIAENLQSIGYVLFHTRKDIGQHLFRVRSVQLIKSVEDLPMDIYKNVNTTEIYVVIDIEMSNEIDSTEIHSSKKEFTPNTRYDAQYSTIVALSNLA